MAAPVADDVTPLGRTAEATRRAVLALVRSGSVGPGERLPGERELADTLGVSRSTLRQALGALEQDGTVQRRPGRSGGTFVAPRKVERDLSRIVGVPAMLREQGFTAGSRVIATAFGIPDQDVVSALELSSGELAFTVERLRLADGEPISLERASFPAAVFPGLLEQSLGGSIYELMATRYGVQPAEALEHLEVVAAGEDHGPVLAVAPGTPLLSVVRVARDATGRPIEHSVDLFRADRTRIVVRSPGAGRLVAGEDDGATLLELRA